MRFLFPFFIFTLSTLHAAPDPIALWPGDAPGEKPELPPETNVSKPGEKMVSGKAVTRLTNVSKPTITVFTPPHEKDTGMAILVCPGGGYSILAIDMEGSEACEWLNSIGVTAILLKYRVPQRPGDEEHKLPLQDAQRAIGIIRNHAADWGINPKRIGALGFSAGGHLVAHLSTNNEQREYPKVDEADDQSCRPDFALMIYPGVTAKGQDKLVPELKVTDKTPPTFLVQTEDDRSAKVESSLYYYMASKAAQVPAEMHLYPKGGHGYGLRSNEQGIANWPERAGEWILGQQLEPSDKPDAAQSPKN